MLHSFCSTMAAHNFALFSVLLSSCIFFCAPSPTTAQQPQHHFRARNHHGPPQGARNNLAAACQATRYQSLCVRSLSKFPNASNQSPQQLAQLALAVSLYRARNVRAYLVEAAKQLEAQKAREYPMVRDCLSQLGDGISQLSQSIDELRRLSHLHATVISDSDFLFHASNVETWTSAAYTDASFCLNDFPTRRLNKMKATVRGKVLNVAQVTSNALALVHQYTAKYRSVKP